MRALHLELKSYYYEHKISISNKKIDFTSAQVYLELHTSKYKCCSQSFAPGVHSCILMLSVRYGVLWHTTTSYRIVPVTSHKRPLRLRNGHSCCHPSHCADKWLLMSHRRHSVHCPTKWDRFLLRTYFWLLFLCSWSKQEYTYLDNH